MWSVPNGTLMNVFSGHNSRVTSGGFTPDGKKKEEKFIDILIFIDLDPFSDFHYFYFNFFNLF